jgi:predicted metalloprotease with PDZ domain
LTSYYDDLLLKHAEFLDQKQYFEALSRQIGSLQTTPGRLVHPVEMSSYDAWIKGYRRDENSINTSISYYTKGAVIGFLLDAKVRKATKDERSLDDVMRLAYERYSGQKGFTRSEFRATASEVAGMDLSQWFRRVLETTEELDYTEALEYFGLRFEDDSEKEKEESEEDKEPAAWLGFRTEDREGRLIITQVRRDTPAYEYGFNVGDEILAIDDYRVTAGKLEDRLTRYRPKDQASVLIARREKLLRIEVDFGEKPLEKWKIETDPDATAEQKARLENWLAGS